VCERHGITKGHTYIKANGARRGRRSGRVWVVAVKRVSQLAGRPRGADGGVDADQRSSAAGSDDRPERRRIVPGGSSWIMRKRSEGCHSKATSKAMLAGLVDRHLGEPPDWGRCLLDSLGVRVPDRPFESSESSVFFHRGERINPCRVRLCLPCALSSTLAPCDEAEQVPEKHQHSLKACAEAAAMYWATRKPPPVIGTCGTSRRATFHNHGSTFRGA